MGEEGRAKKTSKSKNKASFASAFAALGLAPHIVRAIQKKGYGQPTPVQRKCIPLLIAGQDVIGLARTGSGKTAAFVLPILHRLRTHSARTGVRAIILSPSRELALQTLKFAQQMVRFTDLRVAALIGGDGLDEQFASLASNPDIIVATPGRLLHVCVEAGISLKTVTMVVWDEADRLLEDASMSEQLKDIMARCPQSRQTALFSATLPQALADFARAGLNDPEIVRLDAESQLSPDLSTAFLSIRNAEKEAALAVLLERLCLKPGTMKTVPTVIFAATKHHVEYLQELLGALGYPATYVYGTLDQAARELALDSFRSGRRTILVVTDVAARGLDIPLLDAVVNFDFPATPKLFVHRVGRVARAGRSGTAYSLVTPDELPYLYELSLFLQRPVVTRAASNLPSDQQILLCSLPPAAIGLEIERLANLLSINGTLESLQTVMGNASKLYRKTRAVASAESHRHAKAFLNNSTASLVIHPAFSGSSPDSSNDTAAMQMIEQIRSFKPRQALFDGSTSKGQVRTSRQDPSPSSEPAASFKDQHNYLEYRPATGTGDKLSFGRIAANGVFDTGKDDLIKVGSMLSSKLKKQRDSKNVKQMKTEFGTSVPASYKAGNYEKWCAKTRLVIPKPGEAESTEVIQRAKAIVDTGSEKRRWRGKQPGGSKGIRKHFGKKPSSK